MQIGSIYNQITRSERTVAKFLRRLEILLLYEKPIYVEVCESEDFNYRYRKMIYKENGYKVIVLHLFKDSNKWKK